MIVWCGMVIFPVSINDRDGYGRPFVRQFVVNGCLMKHIMNPKGHPAPENDNERIAA